MKDNTPQIIKKFDQTLPHFPNGRINYSNSDTAPVLMSFIEFQNKLLLLKRSQKVRTYKGKWHVVGGYLDELVPLKKKAASEVQEELGITLENILSIKQGKSFRVYDEEESKTWIIHPFLFMLKDKPKIILDWEHTRYVWVKPKDLQKYDIAPGVIESGRFLGLLQL